jgi:hypothetical protein
METISESTNTLQSLSQDLARGGAGQYGCGGDQCQAQFVFERSLLAR